MKKRYLYQWKIEISGGIKLTLVTSSLRILQELPAYGWDSDGKMHTVSLDNLVGFSLVNS